MSNPLRLQRWRQRLGWRLLDVALKLHASTATLCDLERGKKEPGRDLAILIENLTEGEVPIDGWSGDPAVRRAMRALVSRRAARLSVGGPSPDAAVRSADEPSLVL